VSVRHFVASPPVLKDYRLRMIRMVRRTPILLVAVLVFGACGGSTKKVDPAADLAVAKTAALTAADLPSYFAKPFQKSSDIPISVKKNFAKCLNVAVTIFDDTPGAQKVHSPDFTRNSESVSSSVEIDPKASDVDKGWNQLTTPGVARCLQQLFQAAVKLSAPSGVTFGATTVTKFDVAVGSRSIGYTAKFSATSQSKALVFYVDFVFVARDRAGIEVDTSNVGQPFDRAAEIALARKMYDRIGTKAS
jgi:hypothetical protein